MQFESSNRVSRLFNSYEVIGTRNRLFGEHEEVYLNMRTYYASQMKVIASCGKMEYVYIRIPISLFFTGERYVGMCQGIADNMNLGLKHLEVLEYNGYACIITGIKVSAFIPENKISIQNIVEEMADYVMQFRKKLDDWGYTDQDTDY